MHERIVTAAVELAHVVEPEVHGAKLLNPERVRAALTELTTSIREHHGGLPMKHISAVTNEEAADAPETRDE